MKVIQARNAHQALPEVMYQMKHYGKKRDSRNGPVLKFTTPATIMYNHPTERVVFYSEREANPFFHLFESLWMLAGRNDTEYLCQFVPRMMDFSDDGKTFHGAYGYRWRNHFGYDQLPVVINALKNNPDDRRCVVGMWDPNTDLGKQGKDFPCNTQCIFAINDDGNLDMTVYNRSNDSVLGAVGANVVHFSVLQEYMASQIGVGVGRYWQVSNNMHLYLDTHEKFMHQMVEYAYDFFGQPPTCPYELGITTTHPLISIDPTKWDEELAKFMEDPTQEFTDPFFEKIAKPMFAAHQLFKTNVGEEKYKSALQKLSECVDCDWKKASIEWIDRRYKKFLDKQNGAV